MGISSKNKSLYLGGGNEVDGSSFTVQRLNEVDGGCQLFEVSTYLTGVVLHDSI
jgi:hypothetical protein